MIFTFSKNARALAFVASLGVSSLTSLSAATVVLKFDETATWESIQQRIEEERLKDPDVVLEVELPAGVLSHEEGGLAFLTSLSGDTFKGVKNAEGKILTVLEGQGKAGDSVGINNLGGYVTLSDMVFKNFVNKSSMQGSAISGSPSGSFFKNVQFIGNGLETTSSSTVYGGVISSGDRRLPTMIDSCLFEGNFVSANSATNLTIRSAVLEVHNSTGSPELSKISNTTFRNNTIEGISVSSAFLAGAALDNNGGNLENNVFENNGIFGKTEGDYTASYGGALYMKCDFSLKDGGIIRNSSFSGNFVKAYAKTEGGEFGPRAHGGAAYGMMRVIDSDFTNNYAAAGKADQAKGGAIFITDVTDFVGEMLLDVSADTKDSVFSGNKMGLVIDEAGNILNEGVANAIYISPRDSNFDKVATRSSVINFSAKEGRSVYFYDPVVMETNRDMGIRTATMNFNGGLTTDVTPVDYEGRIVFSGKDFLNAGAENRTSRISKNVDMVQHGGSLVISDKAVVGAVLEHERVGASEVGAKSFTMKKGTLEIVKEGHLLASTVIITDNAAGNAATSTLRIGSGAQLSAGIVHIDRGVTLDLAPFLAKHDSGLRVTADTMTLGGTLAIGDTGFYNSAYWGSDHEFLVFALEGETQNGVTGTFEGIISTATQKSKVEGFAYNGEWLQVWKDTNNDGTNDELYAVWKASNPIPEPASATLGLLGLAALMMRRRR